jgi:hypothetical protein
MLARLVSGKEMKAISALFTNISLLKFEIIVHVGPSHCHNAILWLSIVKHFLSC